MKTGQAQFSFAGKATTTNKAIRSCVFINAKTTFWKEIHETENRGYVWGGSGSFTFYAIFFCIISVFIFYGLKTINKVGFFVFVFF